MIYWNRFIGSIIICHTVYLSLITTQHAFEQPAICLYQSTYETNTVTQKHAHSVCSKSGGAGNASVGSQLRFKNRKLWHQAWRSASNETTTTGGPCLYNETGRMAYLVPSVWQHYKKVVIGTPQPATSVHRRETTAVESDA